MTSPTPAEKTTRLAPIFVKPADMPKIYCDGMSQLLMGYPVSRLTLHDLVERNPDDLNAPEIRHIVGELVMPTAGLIDMARHILAATGQTREVLLKIEGEYSERLHAAIDGTETQVDPLAVA